MSEPGRRFTVRVFSYYEGITGSVDTVSADGSFTAWMDYEKPDTSLLSSFTPDEVEWDDDREDDR